MDLDKIDELFSSSLRMQGRVNVLTIESEDLRNTIGGIDAEVKKIAETQKQKEDTSKRLVNEVVTLKTAISELQAKKVTLSKKYDITAKELQSVSESLSKNVDVLKTEGYILPFGSKKQTVRVQM